MLTTEIAGREECGKLLELEKDYISDYKCHTPDTVLSEIQAANFLIICTSFWCEEILNELNITYQKSFDEKSILVIDYA